MFIIIIIIVIIIIIRKKSYAGKKAPTITAVSVYKHLHLFQ